MEAAVADIAQFSCAIADFGEGTGQCLRSILRFS